MSAGWCLFWCHRSAEWCFIFLFGVIGELYGALFLFLVSYERGMVLYFSFWCHTSAGWCFIFLFGVIRARNGALFLFLVRSILCNAKNPARFQIKKEQDFFDYTCD
ncbi:hypothetical protein D1B32_01400 [Oceanobacillus profundus]|uniref:Uncharacterized protein n=1 Tax=Oceanobacillus profundus TaxID=372463 RepID=A0A417YNA4_9BACI|nr:hypothetical protein D1B32_01400 [Oceanobacillus profundus]